MISSEVAVRVIVFVVVAGIVVSYFYHAWRNSKREDQEARRRQQKADKKAAFDAKLEQDAQDIVKMVVGHPSIASKKLVKGFLDNEEWKTGNTEFRAGIRVPEFQLLCQIAVAEEGQKDAPPPGTTPPSPGHRENSGDSQSADVIDPVALQNAERAEVEINALMSEAKRLRTGESYKKAYFALVKVCNTYPALAQRYWERLAQFALQGIVLCGKEQGSDEYVASIRHAQSQLPKCPVSVREHYAPLLADLLAAAEAGSGPRSIPVSRIPRARAS